MDDAELYHQRRCRGNDERLGWLRKKKKASQKQQKEQQQQQEYDDKEREKEKKNCLEVDEVIISSFLLYTLWRNDRFT